MRAFAAIAIIAGVASADGHDMMGCSAMSSSDPMMTMGSDAMDGAERIKIVQDLIDVFCGDYDLEKMDYEGMHHDPMSHGGMGSGGFGSGGFGSGGMSCGGMSCGGMSCGGMSCGGMSCGGMSCGGMSCGGMSCGGMSCGGMWSSGDMTCGEMHSSGRNEQLCKQAQMMLNALVTYSSTGRAEGAFYE